MKKYLICDLPRGGFGANNVQFPKLSSYLLSYRSNGTRGFTYVDWETEKISYTIK